MSYLYWVKISELCSIMRLMGENGMLELGTVDDNEGQI